jgi:hypothetical protein
VSKTISASGQFKVLRVEESPVATVSVPSPVVVSEATRASVEPKTVAADDADHWRRLAVQTSERLSIAETQAKALREAADDARARFGKYKDRLDKAQTRVNELQIQVVRLSTQLEAQRAAVAERDAMLLSQADISRELHAVREAAREWVDKGPLWDVFVKFAVCPPSAGEEKR